MLVANNGGPSTAAALGTPVVDLYALTNPQHTPWRRRRACSTTTCRAGGATEASAPRAITHCLRGVGRRKSGRRRVRTPRSGAATDAALFPKQGRPLMYARHQRGFSRQRGRACWWTAILVAAAEDERFSHIKHAQAPAAFSPWQLPFNAIDFCLKEAGIKLADLDHVAYSYDPRLLSTMPSGSQPTIELPLEPGSKPSTDESVRVAVGPAFSQLYRQREVAACSMGRRIICKSASITGGQHLPRFNWHYVDHHLSHEASAFLAAPFYRYRRAHDGRPRGRRDHEPRTIRRWRVHTFEAGGTAPLARAAL